MASYAVSTWTPQFDGENKEWGNAAENYLFEHDKIFDVRGGQFDRKTWLRHLVRAHLIDGDTATMLVENESGFPQIQVFQGHRIGSNRSLEDGPITQGPYAGMTMVDGVVLDSAARAVAFQILGSGQTDHRIVPAENMILHFYPTSSDQVRGMSALGCALLDWKDIKDARRFEMIAQKIGASIALIENNDTGSADPAKILMGVGAGADSNGSTEAVERMSEGGEIRYFKAGSQSSLTAFAQNRPSQNQRDFEENVLRAALHGLRWSYDFSVNPTKAGGAQMRIIIDKINRNLEDIRAVIVEPACRRIDGWRIAKAMQRGDLPWSDEWWRWKYQGPARLTADEKYSSDVSLQELTIGLTTYEIECAKRGEWWQDVMKQKVKERATFERLCKEEGVDPGNVILLTPNGNPSAQQQQQQTKPQQSEGN
jgi:capsid protein